MKNKILTCKDKNNIYIKITASLLGLFLLTGCTTHTTYLESNFTMPDSYTFICDEISLNGNVSLSNTKDSISSDRVANNKDSSLSSKAENTKDSLNSKDLSSNSVNTLTNQSSLNTNTVSNNNSLHVNNKTNNESNIDTSWWKNFNSPTLVSLIEEAKKNS
ncbi:MAG: hypothetical protein ACK5LP_02620, partial [Campylobacteraceae bacterium]